MGGTGQSTQVDRGETPRDFRSPRSGRSPARRHPRSRQERSSLLCGATPCGCDESGTATHVIMLKDSIPYPTQEMKIPCGAAQVLTCEGRISSRPPNGMGMFSEEGSYLKLDERTFQDAWEMDMVTNYRKRFDFDAFGAIPNGWVKSTRRVPDAFLFAGGDAISIEREVEECPADMPCDADESHLRRQRVLLALPETSVDLKRAKWLCRRPGFGAEAGFLCHLCRTKECKAIGSVVFEFDYPQGVPLSEMLNEKRWLSVPKVQVLINHLIKLVTCLSPSPLRLLGFIDPCMVFCNDRDELEVLLPLGCLLTDMGAKAAMFQVIHNGTEWSLAPELKRAVVTKDRSLVMDMDMASITDAYAIAVLALRALGQERIEGREILVDLPDLGRDMLNKALHHEPEWRLSGTALLEHPWMNEQVISDERPRCV